MESTNPKVLKPLLVNNGEKKILEDYSNIKKQLKTNKDKFENFSPSSWTEFIENRNLNDETVKSVSYTHLTLPTICSV